MIVSHPGSTQDLSFINLVSAHNVITNAAEYFPSQAMSNTRDWLATSPQEWKQGDNFDDPSKDVYQIRYGVLSGFSLEAAILYAPFQRLEKKIINRLAERMAPEEVRRCIITMLTAVYPNNELREEISMDSDNIEKLISVLLAARVKSKIDIYLARDLFPSKKDPDEDEILEIIKMPFDEAYEMFVSGREPTTSYTLVAFLMAKALAK